MVHMIVASTAKGVIGKNNKLPWHIPSELEFFKDKTEFQTLLMGYNTYKSLPGKLPNRQIIVLTRKELEGVETITLKEIKHLFESFANSDKILFIAGGKQLYESFYQNATKIYHSIINKEYDGDTYIHLDYKNYIQTKTLHKKDFVVKVYNRK